MSKNEPGIWRSLDVSTGHIPHEDLDLLTIVKHRAAADALGLHMIGYTEYGSIVHVPLLADIPDADERLVKNASDKPYLFAIMALARKHECQYIWFDADGMEHPELKRFDHAIEEAST